MTTNQTIEIGSNPSRFLGVNYSAAMYALRNYDPRAMVTLHLVFIVLWVRLPWSHVSPKSLGATSEIWGFCLGLRPTYFRFSWGTP